MDYAFADRLSELFEQALSRPVDERAAFLKSECGEDVVLRTELSSLLAAHDRSGNYFEVLADQVALPALQAVTTTVTGGLPPGTIVANYEIVEQLGRGGMGVVYKARDQRLNRFVALKFLAPQLSGDELARGRLVREAQAASALDHPHIAIVHEIGETEDGRLFIAMGWYEGETLQEILRRGPLPIDHILAVARQLGAALEAAHAAGIVHRDVKASNVIVGRGGARLLDFGIARLAGAEHTTDGSTPGTVTYMSPEQTRGDTLDHRTDLWSLGVLLYEMTTGRRPFVGDGDQAVIFAIRNDEPEPVPDLRPNVPPSLAEAISTCLEKDPSQRFSNASDLLASLTLDTPIARPAAKRRRVGNALPTSRPALFLSAALVIALITTHLFTVFAAPAVVLDGQRVLVAPLENRTGEAALDPVGSMAADWIIQGLSQTGIGNVVPMTAALSASRFAAAASTDPAAHIRALADETGAGIIVSGAYYRQGEALYLQVSVTDAGRNRVIHALQPVITRTDLPLTGIETLRNRVLGVLAPQLNPRTQHHTAGGGVAPPSFEAYRAHAEGMEHFTAADWASAIPLFLAAAAHDSTFTVPLLYAGIAFGNMGKTADADSILMLIRPRFSQLGEFEQLGFNMLDASLRGDHAAFYRSHLRAPEIAPGTFAHWGLALGALNLNRPREALRILQELDPERGELRGWFRYWITLTKTHHQLGEHRKELRSARRARALIPDDPGGIGLEIRALAALGRTRAVKRLIAEQAPEAAQAAPLLRLAGLELIAHGHRVDGEVLLRESLDQAQAHQGNGASSRLFVAQAAYLVGDWDEAERLLRELALDHPESIQVQGSLGAIAARRGDTDEAYEVSEWLRELDGPYLYGLNSYWRAKIASLLGDPEDAVRLLRQRFQEGAEFDPWLPLHRDTDLYPIREHAAYHAFVRPKG